MRDIGKISDAEIQVPRFQRFPDSRVPDSRGFTVLLYHVHNIL